MNDDLRVRRAVDAFLADAAPSHGPHDLLDDVFLSTSRMRPRRRWLALLKEPPMRYDFHLVTGSPALRLAAIIAMTVSLVLGLTAIVAGAATLLPSPSVDDGPHNGLIAFDSNGDIWVTDIEGSVRNQLTSGPSWDRTPVWSPDGQQIAYWSQRNPTAPHQLLIIAADGSEPQVVRNLVADRLDISDAYTWPEWSPDGALSRTRSSPSTAGALHRAAGSSRPARRSGSPAGRDPRWAPDGASIAYQAEVSGDLGDLARGCRRSRFPPARAGQWTDVVTGWPGRVLRWGEFERHLDR